MPYSDLPDRDEDEDDGDGMGTVASIILFLRLVVDELGSFLISGCFICSAVREPIYLCNLMVTVILIVLIYYCSS
jgi:hypothetical protein